MSSLGCASRTMSYRSPPTAHGQKLSAQQVHDQGQDNADEDAGPQREVKAEIVPLVTDVPRQPSQSGNLRGQQKDRPHDHQDHADHDQPTAQVNHGLVTPTFPSGEKLSPSNFRGR
jgi:hypothetical protein